MFDTAIWKLYCETSVPTNRRFQMNVWRRRRKPAPLNTANEPNALLAEISEDLARMKREQDAGRAATKIVVEEVRKKRILREARRLGV